MVGEQCRDESPSIVLSVCTVSKHTLVPSHYPGFLGKPKSHAWVFHYDTVEIHQVPPLILFYVKYRVRGLKSEGFFDRVDTFDSS